MFLKSGENSKLSQNKQEVEMSKIPIWKIVSRPNPFLVRGREIFLIVAEENIYVTKWFSNFSSEKISNQTKIEASKWHLEAIKRKLKCD